MTKLSGLGTETTFGQSDYLVKVKAAGAGDVLVKLSDLQIAMGANTYNPYKFSVSRNAALTPANPGIITFDTKLFDTGSNYSTSTGLFTATVPGFYLFQSGVWNNTNTTGEILLQKNGSSLFGSGFNNNASGENQLMLLAPPPVQLAANDTVQVTSATGNSITVGPASCYFGGFLISAT